MRLALLLTVSSLLLGCGNTIDSAEEAEMAFLGLQGAIRKAMDLGFDGFNEAVTSSFAPQETVGDLSGTLLVEGQVYRVSSSKEVMLLNLTMDQYGDLEDLDPDGQLGFSVVYWTYAAGDQPKLNLRLREVPDRTFEGTLTGSFGMVGELEGEARLKLDLSGRLESDGAGGTRWEAGSTTITGKVNGASSDVYQVEATL